MANLIEFMRGNDVLVPGRFGLECDWGLLDISYRCTDDVIARTPIALTSYYNQPQYSIITGRNKAVATRPSDDECGYSVANYWLDKCDFLAPQQREVSIGLPKQRENALLERLCNPRIFRPGCSIFNTDGTIKAGDPITETFIEQQGAQLGEVNADAHEEYFWDGDPAFNDQYQGIWDQIIDGHDPVDQGQDCGIQALVIDWEALTESDPGEALPTSTISQANNSFVVGPYTFSNMAGKNLVDVFLKWYRTVKNVLMKGKGRINWEIWGPTNGVECIAEAAACTQPCGGADASDDPTVRGRVAEAVRSLTMRLYPHDDDPIPILQSPYLLNTNRMVFTPFSIGNDLMRVWTFRPATQDRQVLESVLGPLSDRRLGSFDPTPFIPRETTGPMVDMEEMIFTTHHEKDQNCISSWVNSVGVPLVFCQHLMMVVENVVCDPDITPICVNNYNGELAYTEDLTTCGAGGSSTELNLTFPNADDTFDNCAQGDMILVTTADEITISGTITAVNQAQPTADIDVDFGFDIDCNFGGGIAAGTITYGCA